MWIGHSYRIWYIQHEIQCMWRENIFSLGGLNSYLAAASEDYKRLLRRLFQSSRLKSLNEYPKDELKLALDDHLIIDANISWQYTYAADVNISISIGAHKKEVLRCE